MKKISTIATVIFMTIFTTAIAKSASAACTITGTNITQLRQRPPFPTFSLNGSGSVTVVCNDTGKSLQLSQGGGTVVGNARVFFRFRGGTGGFSGIDNTQSRAISAPTATGGDRADFNVSIDTNNTGKALNAGNYILVIDATIVP